MLDSICEPHERDAVLFQWKDDEHLLRRNTFIGDIYNAFQEDKSLVNFMRAVMGNYILEGVYFYSGFMFFYNLGRNNRMPGSVQQIRYINRDEATHLYLFKNIITELEKEVPSPLHPGDENHVPGNDPGGLRAGNRLGAVRHRGRDPGPDWADGV